jgi:exodeoxyribonuclease-1
MGENSFQRTFYWFDYETFGTDARKDRPAQFGGLRTDEQLRDLGDSLLLYCQPAEDYLPDPGASLVTGITPLTCLDEGIPEANFAEEIHKKLSQPGTVGVGYNNLRFDDEVTRFLFWRNLIDPYGRERGDGRGRFDLFVLMHAVFAFRFNAISWPKREDGLYSLRLEELTKANNLVHNKAHDAQSDAKATLALARLIRQKEPKFWDYALKLMDTAFVEQSLRRGIPMLFVNPFVGQQKKYLSLIFPLMPDPGRSKTWFCWDLSEDPAELQNLTLKDLKERLFVSKEQAEAGVKKVPLISVQLNKQPFFVRAEPYMTPELSKILRVDAALMTERCRKIQDMDLRFLNNLWAELAESNREKWAAEPQEAEVSLYGGKFLDQRDRSLLDRLRKLPAEELAERGMQTVFSDDRLSDLLFRYQARNFPETIYQLEDSKKWYQYRVEHLFEGKGGARTFDAFYASLQALREAHPEKEDILNDLQEYADTLRGEYGE